MRDCINANLDLPLGPRRSRVLLLVWGLPILLFGLGVLVQITVVQRGLILDDWLDAHRVRGAD